MNEPVIAAREPVAVELKAGQTIYWCSCGRSKTQPYCDGSHQGTGFEPVAYTAERDGVAHLCMCKHSKNPPLCDGSHENLD